MIKIYPRTIYKVDDFDYLKVTDLTFYFKIKDFIKSFGFENGRTYKIQDGMAPAVLSYKEYGSSRFENSILILNDIRNIHDEWPKSEIAFREYLEIKYGSFDYTIQNVANYFRNDGLKVSRETWFSLNQADKYTESIYEYEYNENERKSNIKLVDYNVMVNFEVELRRQTMILISDENTKVR